MQDMFENHFKREQDAEDFRCLSQASDLTQTTVSGLLALAHLLSSNRNHVSIKMLITVDHLLNDLDGYYSDLTAIVREATDEK